jgi:lipopolysaccharide biosynthesis protein
MTPSDSMRTACSKGLAALTRNILNLRSLLPASRTREALLSPIEIRTREGSRKLLIPVFSGVDYQLIPKMPIHVSADGELLESSQSGFIESIIGRATNLTTFKKKKRLEFHEFTLLGTGDARRNFYHLNASLNKFNMGFDSVSLQHTPQILEGWKNPAFSSFPAMPNLRCAVVLHLFYQDLWPEIESLLLPIREHFDLVLSTTNSNPDLFQKIKTTFPRAEIHLLENRGRDVRPFLHLLEQGFLAPYDLICKIHGKRSFKDGRMDLFGDIWRRKLFADLMGSAELIQDVQKLFVNNPDLGMVGSQDFRLPNKHWSELEAWGSSRPSFEQLRTLLLFPADECTLDYFSGTMFWVRPEALKALAPLQLSKQAFLDEAGNSCGNIEHAIERILPTVVRQAGYTILSL